MWRSIFIAAFFAGSLDIMAASIYAYFKSGLTPDMVLKYIASGVFGNNAFERGANMILAGLIFHYVIAIACTVVFFLIYPKLNVLQRSPWVNAFVIALVAWWVTTQWVIPMSKIDPRPFNLSDALIAIGILIVCIGLPIAFLARNYYRINAGSK